MYDIGMAILTALFTFISPCVLPLLPVFVTYFAATEKDDMEEITEDAQNDGSIEAKKDSEGSEGAENKVIVQNKENAQVKKAKTKRRIMRTLFNALAFCVGFSIIFLVVFTSIAFLSFAVSSFINLHKQKIYAICGMILVLLGLKFMGYLHLPFLDKKVNIKTKTVDMNILNAFVLGVVFSLSIGSCAFVFASFDLINVIINSENVLHGILIGVTFTATLDILFLICALLIDQLKGVLTFIKRHYNVINMVMGIIMVVLGVLMAVGFMEVISGWMV